MKKLSLLFCSLALVGFVGCGGDDDDDNGTADAATDTDAAGSNTAPVAAFTMDPTCTSSSVDPVAFTSTSTDADGDTLTCSWTFASGTPASSSECDVTGVTFPNAAPYDVTLTVDDGNGGTNSTTMSIGPC